MPNNHIYVKLIQVIFLRGSVIMKKTKIICTIGPASESKEIISAMTEVGCDVVRLNFSHGTHADHAEKIKIIKEKVC